MVAEYVASANPARVLGADVLEQEEERRGESRTRGREGEDAAADEVLHVLDLLGKPVESVADEAARAAEGQPALERILDLRIALAGHDRADEDLAAGVARAVDVEDAAIARDVVVAEEGEASVLALEVDDRADGLAPVICLEDVAVAKLLECLHLGVERAKVDAHLALAVLGFLHHVSLQFDCHLDHDPFFCLSV